MKDLPTSRFPAASLALAMTIAGTVGAFVTEAGLHPVTDRVLALRVRRHVPRRMVPAARLSAGPHPVLVPPRAGRTCRRLHGAELDGLLRRLRHDVDRHDDDRLSRPAVLRGASSAWSSSRSVSRSTRSCGCSARSLASCWPAGWWFRMRHASTAWALGIALTLGAALLYAVATILAKGLGQQRAEITVLCQTIVGDRHARAVRRHRPACSRAFMGLAGQHRRAAHRHRLCADELGLSAPDDAGDRHHHLHLSGRCHHHRLGGLRRIRSGRHRPPAWC